MNDPERQPLLYPANAAARNRRFRALSYEEVLSARQEVHWRRGRCLLIFLFWGILVMCLSMIACILITAPHCKHTMDSTNVPIVPPVHMSLASLISHGRAVNDMNEYEFYAM